MRRTKIIEKQCNYKRCTYRRMKRRKYCEKHVQLFIDKEAGEQPIMQTISDVMQRDNNEFVGGLARSTYTSLNRNPSTNSGLTLANMEKTYNDVLKITKKKSLKEYILGFIFIKE